MKQKLRNIFHLGVKEIRGLARDPLMVVLIVYIFTFGVYSAATSVPDTLSDAVIAIVDEDRSPLSLRIADGFVPPFFKRIDNVSLEETDAGLDRGKYTFVMVIPAGFQRDVLAGRSPKIQLSVDATRMSQAFTGSGYIQEIAARELAAFFDLSGGGSGAPVEVILRNRFNPNLIQMWFSAVMELVNNITSLAIILAGAALIRERERGTLEHLLVMPVTSFEIMLSKIWSMVVVVESASLLSLVLMIEGALKIPLAGSLGLFAVGVMLLLFSVTSMGIFLATVARDMPQLGMLMILLLMPMQILSGGVTPQESMPTAVRLLMQMVPTTHFVAFSQAILFRGAGASVVWLPFLKLTLIGGALFLLAWRRFRRSVA